MKILGLVLSFYFASVLVVSAQDIETVRDGNALVRSTWSCDCIPGEHDSVTVSHRIVINRGTALSVHDLVIQSGATIFGYNTYSGGNKPAITIHGSLQNDGITTGYLDSYVAGNVSGSGQTTGTIILTKQAASYDFSQLEGALELATDITFSDDIDLNISLDASGFDITFANNPTITLKRINSPGQIHGSASITLTNQSTLLATPDADISYSSTDITNSYAGAARARSITLGGLVNLFYDDATFQAENITINPETTVSMGGNTSGRSTTFDGDLVNYGHIRATGDYRFTGNITNYGVFEKFPGSSTTVGQIRPVGTGQFLVATSHYALSGVKPVSRPAGLYIGEYIIKDIPYYITELQTNGFYGPIQKINQHLSTTAQIDVTPAELQEFHFSLIRDQQLRTPFDVAIDHIGSFTGRAYLSSDSGEIYPRIIDFENGRWSGQIHHFGSGDQQQIIVTAPGITRQGSSNYFNVQVPAEQSQVGTVTGSLIKRDYAVIADDYDIDLAGYTITLSDSIGNTHETTITDNNSFIFHDIPCGTYSLSIPDVVTGTYKSIVRVTCGETVHARVFRDVQSCDTQKTPVLLVPGIMGSDSQFSTAFINHPIPKITQDIPIWNSGRLHIHDPGNVVGFNSLTKALRDEGYVYGCDIFHVPYDWSLQVPEAAQLFLKPWVQHAKATTNSAKVDVVAHSMGGLLVRSYIHDNPKTHSIDNLIMVGTPNQGSANTYYSWVHGNPIETDALEDTKLLEQLFGMDQFQTNTIVRNHQIKGTGDALCWGNDLDYTECDRERTLDFLHALAPSVGNLYPTYPFLFDRQSETELQSDFENTFLQTLSKPESHGVTTHRLAGVLEDLDGNLLRTTFEKIFVDRNKYEEYLFEDGTIYSHSFGVGDGTVLFKSAGGEKVGGFKSVEHKSVIKEFRHIITDLLK